MWYYALEMPTPTSYYIELIDTLSQKSNKVNDSLITYYLFVFLMVVIFIVRQLAREILISFIIEY